MDMRDMRRLPPRNARGEFRRRRSRRDRGMDYAREDMRMRDYGDMNRRGQYNDYEGDMRRNDYDVDMRGGRGRGRSDYGDYDMNDGRDYRGNDMNDMARGYDRTNQEYGDMRRNMDGHHMGRQGGYEPIEFMGYCSGYYGSPDQDYGMRGRGSRMDYGYDMRGRGRGRDYGYDYGYNDYGDYGETLSEKELEEWCKKLKGQLDEREKQMFSKEAIAQKAKQMGKQMEGFGEKELEVATLMVYTDYKNSIGQNVDLAVRLAYDWLTDKDVAVKGAEKLAVYHDCIVEGE